MADEGEAVPTQTENTKKEGSAEDDLVVSVKAVIKNALVHDGISRGLRETVKALDQRKGLLCIMAANCDKDEYSKLVTALCTQHNIPLMTVPNNKELGEWAGLCKLDKDAKPRKVVKCSSLVIRYAEKDDAHFAKLLAHAKKQQRK